MLKSKGFIAGIGFTVILAVVAQYCSSFIPYHLVSGGVFAMLIGMALHPWCRKLQKGYHFVSKKMLRFSIIMMGVSLSFAQVVEVGKISLIVMCFTLLTAFGGGYLLGKLFKMDWKLSSLISAGTGICGGSAIAAISPVIEADDHQIAYAISATFIFDIIMVILFPIMGRLFGMSDLGYGLWTGTAVNDTSSVVAAGYAFSDIAGNYSVIVKLTRTLSIIPVVLIFSLINEHLKRKQVSGGALAHEFSRISLKKIVPYFILLFLVVVAINSLGFIPAAASNTIASLSKFFMVMALGAIGLNTDFKKVAKSGFKPMFHGFLISTLVVVVAFIVQMCLGQL